MSGARLALVVAVAACSSGPGGTTPPSLSARAPQGSVSIAPFDVAPGLLQLEVARVDNPSVQGFGILVAIVFEGPAGTTRVDVGAVSLFPANLPGTFVMRLPPQARELLVRKDGALRLQIDLVPAADDRPLVAPLEVAFGELVWRS